MGMKTLLKCIVALKITVAALLTSSLAEANTNVWVACGDQGQNCKISADDRVMVRYGNPDNSNFFFFAVEGESTVPCSNFIGNPAHDESKQCWYTENPSGIPTSGWSECSTERDTCDTGSDTPQWIRYGAGDKWLYTVQGGTFTCDNDHFQWDPYVGTHKSCEKTGMTINSSWTQCATEGSTCSLSNLGGISYQDTGLIIKYGAGNSWNYKIATQSESIDCSNGIFYDPDKGVSKSCFVTPYLQSDIITTGAWNPVAPCQGGSCTTSYSITWGSTWSDSVTNQQTWSVGVTASATEGIAIPPEKAEETFGYSESYVDSETYQESLTESESQTITINCGDPSDAYVTLYQFSTSSVADCITGSGDCNSATDTQDYICYSGNEPLSTTPQCLPNACQDEYCTICKQPTGNN